ncbi:hypothetical protein LTR97_000168 [Elasticomyces elasticus]|uniref:SGNH hydrolase-type esterase domain-containing protein n=1 Tax=Elasticomyces elasticus TaxID=574655 RepID=A0AAN8A5D5_9PEZI|nr:hypothetical protein LTR97_000168 [Elasticomyces elasticus]
MLLPHFTFQQWLWTVIFASSASDALNSSSVWLDLAPAGNTLLFVAPTVTVYSNLSTTYSDNSTMHDTSATCITANDTILWSDTSGWQDFGLWDNDAGVNVTTKSNVFLGPKIPSTELPTCNATFTIDETPADDDFGTMTNLTVTVHSNHTTNSNGTRFLSPKINIVSSGVQLRILPLGASIVYGLTSPDGNGFRYGLRNQLVYNNNPVNMVGSVQEGTMADNDCEGWPGYVITQVAQKAELSIPSQPNLVLLHVGTNDCVQSIDIQNAASRLGTLIDRLFNAIPGVTIIASTLLPNGNSNTQANIKVYNSQIPALVKARQAAGRKITYVDFSSSYFSIADIGSDGTHPIESGYMKMAEVWFQGIMVANDQGWITAPAVVPSLSDTVVAGSNTCDKQPGTAIGPVQTQMGSGSDDGAYIHTSTYIGGFAGFKNPSTVNFNNPLPEGVFWADIDGDGVDDYVYVGSNSNYGLGVALSQGGGTFGTYLYFTFSPSCNRAGVWFVDITGDGRDDFCCLGPDGGLVCWENTAGSDDRSPNWVALGTVKESEGYPQAQVRLADIDGETLMKRP